MPPRLCGTAALLLLFVAGDASAHRPTSADAWWAGLDSATTRAPAAGVLELRTTPSGRVRVPGGTFVMGSTPAQMAHAIQLCEHEVLATAVCHAERFIAMVRAEGNAHPVTLPTFAIDRTEVTVAEYARCASAGACAPAELGGDVRFTSPDYPVTHVRWGDAQDYCRWTGGRLPTEAEWEYAARGPEEREFPWGNVYNPHLANHGAWAEDRTDATDGFVNLAPVGSFRDGATPQGLLDMAGNVSEWVADVLELDAAGRPVGYPGDAVVDPKPAATSGGFHVVRGGSFQDAPMWLRTAARDTTSAPRPAWVGFRCAADAR
jgi:formylglycine-generating enzyme